MTTFRYTLRPLGEHRPDRHPHARQRSSFTASWSDTCRLLDREIRHLVKGADTLSGNALERTVLMVDCTEDDLRLDGQLRANARLASDAVALSIESRHGPLIYKADRYSFIAYGASMKQVWQHNLRAIGLTLESLRAVDRYGATASGEQYAGFRQIERSRPATARVAPDDARDLLRLYAGFTPRMGVSDIDLVRYARRKHHPDRHDGDRTSWDAIEELATVLGVDQ